MSKKKMQNRLDSLFADLEEEPTHTASNTLPASHEQSIPGWTWQCDEGGYFTACSSEVQDYLGVPPDEMIGQSLTGFLLEAQSSQEIQALITNEDTHYPVDILLRYQLPENDNLLEVSMHIFEKSGVDQENARLRGFTQVLDHFTEENSTQPSFHPLTKNTKPSGEIPARPIPAPTWPQNGPLQEQKIGYLAQDHKVIPAEEILPRPVKRVCKKSARSSVTVFNQKMRVCWHSQLSSNLKIQIY